MTPRYCLGCLRTTIPKHMKTSMFHLIVCSFCGWDLTKPEENE